MADLATAIQGGVWMVPTHCNLQELQHLGGHELADQRKLYQIAGRNERKALVPGAQGPVGKLLVPGVLQKLVIVLPHP